MPLPGAACDKEVAESRLTWEETEERSDDRRGTALAVWGKPFPHPLGVQGDNSVMLRQQQNREQPPHGRLFVIPTRFERVTHSLEGCCSIQLSYGTKRDCKDNKKSGFPMAQGESEIGNHA